MKAFLGPYPMTREGSGTSWVPDTTPHEGLHGRFGDWSTMAHAQFNVVYDNQGGPRGGDKGFVSGMVMAMAQRPLSLKNYVWTTMSLFGPRAFRSAYAARDHVASTVRNLVRMARDGGASMNQTGEPGTW